MAEFPVNNPLPQDLNSSNPRISPRQILTGTQAGKQIIRIKGTIIVNDGSNDRVLIGNFDV